MHNKNYHHNRSTKVILHKPDWLLRKERRDKEIDRKKAAAESRRQAYEDRIVGRWACSGALAGIICLFFAIETQYGWIAGIFGGILGSLLGYGFGRLVGNIIASYSKR